MDSKFQSLSIFTMVIEEQLDYMTGVEGLGVVVAIFGDDVLLFS